MAPVLGSALPHSSLLQRQRPGTRQPRCASYVSLSPRNICSASSASMPTKGHLKKRTLHVMKVISDRPDAAPMESDLMAPKSEKFDWYKQWYPVCVVDKGVTSKEKPNKIQLLGMDLVVWHDGTQWRCFEDKCPHRLAPLSEGRVEKDGTLMCTYHAWRLEGSGACTSIPQVSAKAQAGVCASSRACAVAFPTHEWQGLLFVFASPDAKAAALAPVPTIPELEDASLSSGASSAPAGWGFRDLPYGWEAFFENVTDSAHVPVAHHGIIGNRYTDPKPLVISAVVPLTKTGFKTSVKGEGSEGKSTGYNTFVPPALLRIDSVEEGEDGDGSSQLLVLYCTPTRPGWCRNLGMTVNTRATRGPKAEAAAVKVAAAAASGKTLKPGFRESPKLPYWIIHPLASLFYHQDLVFLHGQQVFLDQVRRTRGLRWAEACFMPGGFDKATGLFRDWLEEHGTFMVPWVDGRVPWVPECDPAMPGLERNPAKLFDVWEQHTKSCEVCQASVRRLTVLRGVLFVAAGLAAAAGAGVAAAVASGAAGGGQWPAGAVSTTGYSFLASGVLALLGVGVHRFRRLYFVYEFSHQDNN